LSRDRTATTLHPRETLLVAGNLGAIDAEIVLDCDGSSSLALDLRGTFSMTIQISGTVDGTNWTLIPVRAINTATIGYVSAVVGTAAGIWVGKCAQYVKIRARVTAYTSGAAAATLVASTAPLDDSLQGMVTTTLGTATGVAGAAVTLTIASPGAGLRHYLTYLKITRFATALMTAAATPVIVTTTNLPGSLAFSIPANAEAQGAASAIQEDFAYPLAASAQGTATTIVCPATTNAIWRVTAGYYIAP
jgi:hypothetical protein